ncbi:MAG: ATP-binding protein, partial [Novibacillus thermophilus]
MLVIVPLAGELNFYPFNDAFRVSFGTPTFFFFLLLLRKIHPVVSGGLVGFLVVGFPILLDFLFRAQE